MGEEEAEEGEIAREEQGERRVVMFVLRRGKIISRTVGGTNLTNYEVGCRNKKTVWEINCLVV